LGWIEEGIIAADVVVVGMAAEEAKSNGGGSKLGIAEAEGDFCWDDVSEKWCKWPKCTCIAAVNLGLGEEPY